MRALFAFLPLLGLAAIAAGGCTGGSSEPPTIPRVTSAVAERDVVDGAAQPSSTIRVEFDRDLERAGGPVPLGSHFELTAPVYDTNGELKDERVIVQDASIPDDAEDTVLLEVAQLIPTGSVLTIRDAAWDSDADGSSVVDVESQFPPEIVVLATQAFQTTDASLLEAGERPITAADRDPAAVRALLEDHLELRGSSDDVRAAALNAYDTMPADIVPAPKMRAALAALTGSFAEPALDSLLTADNCTGAPAALVTFQVPPEAPELLARVTRTDDGRRVVSLQPSLEGERFEHLMPLLAHEPIHCDDTDGIVEEVASTAFDTYLYIILLAVDPSLATGGSTLTRDLAIDAIAFVNSGRLLPESGGILPTDGIEDALPGTTVAVPSFGDFIASAYSQIDEFESPTEPLAQEYADGIAANSGLPEGDAFDLTYLDALLSASMGAETMVVLLDALSLVPAG